jgi:hypothetical protein
MHKQTEIPLLVSFDFVMQAPKVSISLQSTKNGIFAKNHQKYPLFTCALLNLNKPFCQTLCAHFFKSLEDCLEQH